MPQPKHLAKILGALCILFSCVVLFSCAAHKKVSRAEKQELHTFVNTFSNAIGAKDTLWLKAHTNAKTYSHFSTETNGFTDEEELHKMHKRFQYKRKFERTRRSRISVSFGKYSETTGYPGGSMLFEKADSTWICTRYHFIGI